MRKIRYVVACVASVFLIVPSASAHTTGNQNHPSILEMLEGETTAIIAHVRTSVVTLYTKATCPVEALEAEESTEPEQEERRCDSTGSGFFIKDTVGDTTLIVTNHHVVDGAMPNGVSFSLPGSEKQFPVTIVGTDSVSDLALLRIDVDAIPLKERTFTAAQWGDSKKLKRGSLVIALGSPYRLEDSATMGIVSTLDRYGDYNYVPLIQHDAAINRGNSGGPLFNIYGEVVGVNASIYTRNGGSDGISFAIPSYMASFIIAELEWHGRISRGFFGAGIKNLSESDLWTRGLPNTDGALIGTVYPGLPAEQAGIKEGDVILSWNNVPIPNVGTFLREVAATRPGTKVPVTIWRGTRAIMLWVTVTERPEKINKNE